MEDINVNFVSKEVPVPPQQAEQKAHTVKRKKKQKQKQSRNEDKYLIRPLEDTKGDTSRDIFSATRFDELPICDKLKASLRENSYSLMTTIQQRAIPAILSNQYVLVKSETGSGKTFAYLIPILQRMYELSLKGETEIITRDKGAYALIFAPTRELAAQIYESCLKLTRRLSFIVCGALMGGESVKKEKSRLRKGLNIVIATPGRLLYHLKNTQAMAMPNLKFVVFDEADRMLDMGFEKDVKGCTDAIKEYLKEKFQNISVILAAATTGGRLTDLVQNIMSSYISVGFETDTDATVQVPSTIQQYYAIVPAMYKIHYLLAFLFCKHGSKIIVFLSTCQEVNYLHELLKSMNWNLLGREASKGGEEFKLFKNNVYKLHGDMEHSVRKEMFSGFNNAKSGILVSTDVAARGLDFQGVRWVVHYDMNREVKEYVNRIGRTARLNNEGKSLCILMEGEKGYVDRLRETGLNLKQIPDKAILANFQESAAKHLMPGVMKKGKDQAKGMLEGIRALLKTTIGKDNGLIKLAVGAYRSSISAFASRSLKDKKIFNYKELNFTDLAKGFGVAKEWATEDRKKRSMLQGLDKFSQGKSTEGNVEKGKARAGPEGSKIEQLAQKRAKKMEEVVKQISKKMAKSLDYQVFKLLLVPNIVPFTLNVPTNVKTTINNQINQCRFPQFRSPKRISARQSPRTAFIDQNNRSKVHYTWRFKLDGKEHCVELMVSYLTACRRVFQDGVMVFEKRMYLQQTKRKQAVCGIPVFTKYRRTCDNHKPAKGHI
eukprot:TRINITY_DN3509_c0_g1_i1.p1 TRINITY_DN3509_c0_g1~~TRINITY_DN3509_c0_g1_i1.p1  ORF type:complete len:773 (+),score=73.42 TRINITY_DN3509_c0_g1_i1:8566-10884(+)